MNQYLKFLFPKSLYIVEDFMVDHLDLFEARIKELSKQYGTKSNDLLTVQSSIHTFDTLYEDAVFKEFADNVKAHSLEYLKELGLDYLSNVLHYSKMWFNISHKGEFNSPHSHGNSVISGAYYIKAPADSKIIFFKDFGEMMPSSRPTTELGKKVEKLDCTPGRLILFKSDFIHGNGVQSDGEKIVVSFNLGNTVV